MSFKHGTATRVLANEHHVSAVVAGWSVSSTRGMGEVTALLDGGAKFVPGLISGSLALRGPQDHEQALHDEIVAAVDVDNGLIVTCCPAGYAIGKPAMFGQFDPTEFAIDASSTDAVGYSLTATGDDGVDLGYVLHALGAETGDGNGTAVDRGTVGTPSTGGAALVLHATAYSGFTSVGIKVQHSANGTDWTDLASFASITAVGAQRALVADGTTVNRYLRVVTDVTGTGSVTYLVAVAPR